MDRLFLDANVLFSAAYRPDAEMRELWELPEGDATLLSSPYVIEEARRNLTEEKQTRNLEKLVASMAVAGKSARRSDYPGLDHVKLPGKDWPVLLAAISAKASHLITGDRKHFGSYYGKSLAGVLVLSPSAYLAG